jgi:hypothetical protein
MARTYKRDSNGRFAGGGSSSGGGGGGKKGGSKSKSGVAPKKKVKATKANITKKTKALNKKIDAKRQEVRKADPKSAAMKNRGMTKAAQARFDKTKEGKQAKLLGQKAVRQQRDREQSMSTGKGSKARKRAKAMGLKMSRR